MAQHSFYAHGKLLLTSEYFILDGAQALALPTRFGQKMNVSIDEDTQNNTLIWKAFDENQECWLEAQFDLETLSTTSQAPHDLQRSLRAVRELNPDFLKDENSINVETYLEFDKDWGLGSSSTLISMVAEWACIDPFELLDRTYGGSGYDIACAKASQPILFRQQPNGPVAISIEFNPVFKDQLYFVYLNQKQNSREGIQRYREQGVQSDDVIAQVNDLSDDVLNAHDLKGFELCLKKHESFISERLGLRTVQDKYFNDFWGQTKSLGAWGGDFILVTSERSEEETRDYFATRGYKTVLNYADMIL